MHLIGLYVGSDPASNETENERPGLYRKVFDLAFEPIGAEMLVPGGVAFDCRWASNADNMVNRWNRSAQNFSRQTTEVTDVLARLARRTLS